MQHLLKELPRSLVAWCPEQIGWSAYLDNLPLIHEDNPISDLSREVHLMRDADHRHTICVPSSVYFRTLLPRTSRWAANTRAYV